METKFYFILLTAVGVSFVMKIMYFCNNCTGRRNDAPYFPSLLEVLASNVTDVERTDEKIVLLWNSLYTSSDYMFGTGSQPFKGKCPAHERNCSITLDRNRISDADAVVFSVFPLGATLHDNQISVKEVIPDKTKRDQVYVFWNDEPPAYGTRGKLKDLEGVFNITVSFRTDSTIFLPVWDIVRTNTPQAMKDLEKVLASKTKLVAWVVSACTKGHSQRMRYARELHKYIPIDIYGKCGNLSLNCSTISCVHDLGRDYKFYLAFENSICKDYVTEKTFRTLLGDWVPVVLGGADYPTRLPEGSYIDVRNYASPRELAARLLYLDSHDEEYSAYFKWKRSYKVVNRNTKDAFCKICGMLNNNSSLEYERDLDIEAWWEQGACVPDDEVASDLHLE